MIVIIGANGQIVIGATRAVNHLINIQYGKFAGASRVVMFFKFETLGM